MHERELTTSLKLNGLLVGAKERVKTKTDANHWNNNHKKVQFLQLFNRQRTGQRRPQSLFNYNWKAYENIWKSALYVLRDRHILSSSNKVDHLEKNIILWGNMTRCFIDKVCIFIDIANFSLKFKSWSQLLYSEWIWWNWCFLNFRLYSFTRHLQITNHHVC